MAYTLIATQTLVAPSGTVTFSNIPGTFKDLVLEISTAVSASGAADVFARFNNDTATNYSMTQLFGNGTSAGSNRQANDTAVRIAVTDGSTISSNVFQIFQYANTNVNKTSLTRSDVSSALTKAIAGLWRSTSAVTGMTIFPNSGTFNAGSTFKLWAVS